MKDSRIIKSHRIYAMLPLLLTMFFMGEFAQAQDLFKEMKSVSNLANIKGKDISFQDGYLYYLKKDGKARKILPVLVTPILKVSENDFTFSHIAGKSAIGKPIYDIGVEDIIFNVDSNSDWVSDSGAHSCILITRDKITNKVWRVSKSEGRLKIYKEASPWTEEYIMPEKEEVADFTVYDGVVSWVDKANDVWTRSNGEWLKITGNRKANKITVDSKGRLWIVGTNNYIYYRNNNTWVRYGNNSNTAKDIVVPDKTPVVIGSDDILHMGTKAVD